MTNRRLLIIAAIAGILVMVAGFLNERIGMWPIGVDGLHIARAMAIGPQPGTSGTACGPGVFYYGNVVTAAQYLACFQTLQASLGYVPVNQAGDTMQGPLGVTQIVGASGTPSVSAGSGAGTSPTIALVNAHDSDFELDVTTGSAPAGSNAQIAQVTFSVPYSLNSHCAWVPINANAAALSGATAPFGASAAATWTLKSGTSALSAATQYKWDVVCMG